MADDSRLVSANRLVIAEQVLLVVAFVISLRLTVTRVVGGEDACILHTGCDKVLHSALAQVGPIPTAVIGCCATALALALLMIGGGSESISRKFYGMLLGSIALTCCLLQVYSIGVVGATCIMCLSFCIATTGAFISMLFRRTAEVRLNHQFPALILLAILACVQFVVFPIRVLPSLVGTTLPLKRLGLQNLENPLRMELGDSNTSTIVVIADPSCESCKAEVPPLVESVRLHPSRTRLVVLWLPQKLISKQAAAIALAAAPKIGTALAITRIFKADVENRADLVRTAASMGVTQQELPYVLSESSPHMRCLRYDRWLATEMEVRATPAFVRCNSQGSCAELNLSEVKRAINP